MVDPAVPVVSMYGARAKLRAKGAFGSEMMKVLPGALCAALATVAAASPALAQVAEVSPVRGEILVNAGGGFRAITGAAPLQSGDATFARSKALGRLVYADGCSIDVAPGSVIWVRAQSPCKANAGTPTSRDPEPTLRPGAIFDPTWLVDGAALIDSRKPPAGP